MQRLRNVPRPLSNMNYMKQMAACRLLTLREEVQGTSHKRVVQCDVSGLVHAKGCASGGLSSAAD